MACAGDAPHTGSPGTDETADSAVIQEGCVNPEAREQTPFDEIEGGPEWATGQRYAVNEGDEERIDGGGVTVVDLDLDGHLDILLPGDQGVQVFLNKGGLVFEDETDSRVTWDAMYVEPPPRSTAVTAVDLRGIGAPDVLVTLLGGGSQLLLNDGAGNLSAQGGGLPLGRPYQAAVGASFADVDGDGDLDLFQANDLYCHSESGEAMTEPEACGIDTAHDVPNALYINQGGASFVQADERLPRRFMLTGVTHMGAFIDLDADGDQDLMVVNDLRRGLNFAAPTDVLLNDGDGNFSLDIELGLRLHVAGMGLGIGDLNDDQRPDFLVAATDHLPLMVSEADGRWYDQSLAVDLVPDPDRQQSSAWGSELEDLDNDGDLDAVVRFGGQPGSQGSTAEPQALWIQDERGHFVDMAPDWGLDVGAVGRGVAVADLNADGWLDLVTRDLAAPARIFIARCGAESWLQVRLQDTSVNRDGIGARVVVTAGAQRWTRWVRAGGTGLYGSAPADLHFGLGDLDQVDSVEVLWPDGELTVTQAPELRQRLLITR